MLGRAIARPGAVASAAAWSRGAARARRRSPFRARSARKISGADVERVVRITGGNSLAKGALLIAADVVAQADHHHTPRSSVEDREHSAIR